MFTPKFNTLVQRLRILPGVGPKSAQRMALQLLLKQPQAAAHLADALHEAVAAIRPCAKCRSIAEDTYCTICTSTQRNTRLLCVVESAADVMAIEQSGVFKGVYFVLGGKLSPLDGIGPNELGMPLLFSRLTNESIEELIIATNATVEGQATAHYIQQGVQSLNIKMTRIAQGVPQGGELEYVDSHTLSQALLHRLPVRE